MIDNLALAMGAIVPTTLLMGTQLPERDSYYPLLTGLTGDGAPVYPDLKGHYDMVVSTPSLRRIACPATSGGANTSRPAMPYTPPSAHPPHQPTGDALVDLATLASDTVGVLVPFLHELGTRTADRISGQLADHAADQTRGLVSRLHRLLKTRLHPGSHEADLLSAVEADPGSRARQQALVAVLAEYLAGHADLARELGELLAEARQAGAQVQAIDSGMTTGGNLHIEAGGNVVGRDAVGGAKPAES